MSENNSKTDKHIDTGFPKDFLLQILHRIAFSLIPVAVMTFLFSNMCELSADTPTTEFTSGYFISTVIFLALGAVYYAIYTNFLSSQDLYWSYNIRRPKKLFTPLFVIIFAFLITDLVGFGIIFILSSAKYMALIALYVTSISSFALSFFVVELIHTFILHNKYTCWRCNLTCVGQLENNVMDSKWEVRATTTRGTQTDKYKVNGVNVSVTYDTGPETTYTGQGTITGTNTYHCKICGSLMGSRYYKKKCDSEFEYSLHGGK